MLIDSFMPHFDANETHRIEIDAPAAQVYRSLWSMDIAASPIVKSLIALRSLPKQWFGPSRTAEPPPAFNLKALLGAGFGMLAEDEGNELVLGVNGRFWRPVDNLLPFRKEEFDDPIPPGTARAVWNFHLAEPAPGRTLLTTETRIACGDASSRLKFRAYWLLIRPFSGLIRILMLRAIAREAQLRS